MSKEVEHFYVVFNPMLGQKNLDYQTQAHEFYHRLKYQWETETKNPKMYWPKIKKTKRAINDSLNISKFKSVFEKNSQNKQDTYLYITDYTSLWVSVVSGVKEKITKFDFTLDSYRNEEVEVWFEISEMFLISNKSEDTLTFISFFSTDEIKSLNPYLSNLRYPLIVKNDYVEDYFKKDEDGKSIMLKDVAELTPESERIKKIITSYSIPESNYEKLPIVLRKEIISAEMTFLKIDSFSGQKTAEAERIANVYLRVLEKLINHTFIDELRNCKDIENVKTLKNEEIKDKILYKLVNGKSLSLYDIEDLIKKDNVGGLFNLTSYLKKNKKSEFSDYLKSVLGRLLSQNCFDGQKLVDVRNDNTHMEGKIHLSYKEAVDIRNLILGVGSTGLINEIIEKWYCEKSNALKIAA